MTDPITDHELDQLDGDCDAAEDHTVRPWTPPMLLVSTRQLRSLTDEVRRLRRQEKHRDSADRDALRCALEKVRAAIAMSRNTGARVVDVVEPEEQP